VCVLWLRGLVSAQGEIAGTPNHRNLQKTFGTFLLPTLLSDFCSESH